jgi:hypothetical protein
VVLVSPNRHENLGPPLPDPSAHNANLEIYTAAIGKLAQERGHLFVDLFHDLDSRAGGLIESPMTDNGIHLNESGYWRAATVLADAVAPSAARWSVEIDASTGEVSANDAEVVVLSASSREVKFRARAAQIPVMWPAGLSREQMLRFPHPTLLRVTGLEEADYELEVGSTPIFIRVSARDIAKGVPLVDWPDLRFAWGLREEVKSKDLLFFHRWRAHNGEYIYGRRSKTSEDWSRSKDGGNSGNPSFPSEMAELERLIEESDRKMDEWSKPVPHVYELRRVGE